MGVSGNPATATNRSGTRYPGSTSASRARSAARSRGASARVAGRAGRFGRRPCTMDTSSAFSRTSECVSNPRLVSTASTSSRRSSPSTSTQIWRTRSQSPSDRPSSTSISARSTSTFSRSTRSSPCSRITSDSVVSGQS